MWVVDALDVTGWVERYLYPFMRISGLMMTMPLLGTRLVSQRIRLLLAVMMTLVIAPMLPPFEIYAGLSLRSFLIIAQELLIGIAMGFIIELVMQVFVVGGQLIAMQTGLGIATTVDPAQGASVVVISQWFLFMVSLVFLSLNGHLVAIEMLVNSFTTLPISSGGLAVEKMGEIVRWGGWMFSSALIIALPAITALLIVNMAFGVMTRAAPQLNIFALGFPVTMVVGVFIITLNASDFAMSFQNYLSTLFAFMEKLVN